MTARDTDTTFATVDVRVILAGLWTAMMLTYLLGDVMRIFAGDFEAGTMQVQQVSTAASGTPPSPPNARSAG